MSDVHAMCEHASYKGRLAMLMLGVHLGLMV
jgi:hypothetical protein